ncbi:large-conductance mechanosensitive channel [Obelidium mucronatum]|nr:large-conductance mechanosensitive channel [Obelidium mucronatum]
MSDGDSINTDGTIQLSPVLENHVSIEVAPESPDSSKQTATSTKTPTGRRPTSKFIRFGRHVGKGVKGGIVHTKHFALGIFEDIENFLRRGNMVDLMAGVVMGAAFTSIVQSFVSDLITPLIGLITQKNIENNFLVIRCPSNSSIPCQTGLQQIFHTIDQATAAGAVTWNFGKFGNNALNFLLVGTITFYFVKLYAASFLRYSKDPPPKTKKCPECWEENHMKARKCKWCISIFPASEAGSPRRNAKHAGIGNVVMQVFHHHGHKKAKGKK